MSKAVLVDNRPDFEVFPQDPNEITVMVTVDRGPPGRDGAPGEPGLPGEPGSPGVSVVVQPNDPAPSDGAVHDVHINSVSGDWFKKTGVSTWTLIGNLKGPIGDPGADGTNGADGLDGTDGVDANRIYSDDVDPTGSDGNVDDYWINTTSGNLYKKTGPTTWTLIGNMKGPQGDPGPTGSGTGDVIGPVTSVTGNLPLFGDTSGNLLVDSGKAIADFAEAVHSHEMSDITGLSAALSGKSNTGHTHAFADLTSKPTTISGFAISDAYTKTEVDAKTWAWTAITSKPTTIGGYSISDAYTKTEVNALTWAWSAITGKPTTLSGYAITDAINVSQKGIAGGVAPLDVGGKIDVSYLPAIAITDTFEVASQSAMLALTAERGDIAVRSDLNKTFVLKTEPASTLANWVELKTPTDAVLSVAGKTGAVTIVIGDITGISTGSFLGRATAGTGVAEVLTPSQAKTLLSLVKADVGLGNVDNTTDLGKPISTLTQTALNGKVATSRLMSTGTGLTGGGDLTTDRTIAIDKATDSDVRGAASNKVITTDLLESASAYTALTPGGTVAFNWAGGVNLSLLPTTNFTLSNPTNVKVGTWRTIRITQHTTGGQVITFGSNYKAPGGVSTIVLSTANSAVDFISLYADTATSIFVFLGKDMKA